MFQDCQNWYRNLILCTQRPQPAPFALTRVHSKGVITPCDSSNDGRGRNGATTPINPNSVSVYEKRFLTTESPEQRNLREDSRFEFLNEVEIRVDGTNLRKRRHKDG